ncbi:MAG: FHA domain-containing protein, partial [Armatimonadetes bacterium]|nr:FHA domain-containing protein [Armatimonadota bacterium]
MVWARLVGVQGPCSGQQFDLQQHTVSIGRGPTCTVVLTQDPGVAPHHAEIFYQQGAPVVRAMDPLGITLLNGRNLEGLQPLRTGDTLTVGGSTFRFEQAPAVQQPFAGAPMPGQPLPVPPGQPAPGAPGPAAPFPGTGPAPAPADWSRPPSPPSPYPRQYYPPQQQEGRTYTILAFVFAGIGLMSCATCFGCGALAFGPVGMIFAAIGLSRGDKPLASWAMAAALAVTVMVS